MYAFWKSTRKGWAALLVVAIASLIVVTGLPVPQKALAAYADPPNHVIGVNTPARITKLIYPTIGNPSIVKRGTTLYAEFDPREGKYYTPPAGPHIPLPVCTDFTASVTSTNAGAGQITKTLSVASAVAGQSDKWPNLKNPLPGGSNEVYKLTINIPEWLPTDLYDLTVGCTIEGSQYADTQPNSVDVIEEFKANYNFIQMSDIHVYGPENTDASFFYKHSRTERTQRQTSYDASPTGIGYGAKYLHKEVMEINRINPDFVVLTGDYDFGQRYFHKDINYGSWGHKTQYEFEQEWFYQEISKLEVPVYIIIGNHDGYNYLTAQGAYKDEDWFTNWTKLYGPLYFEFEYGPMNKFFAINSMDWSGDQRSLTNYLNIILQPVKYLGQVTSGGDAWAPGCTAESLIVANGLIPGLSGQLGWLRDRLAATQGALTRVMALHHDPWKLDGSGSMWASGGDDWLSKITGIIDMGNGQGRQVLIKLASKYKVQMMVHGHDHSDITSEMSPNKNLLDWESGGGRVISANTTSGSFQGDGNSSEYPGYRRVWINNGVVTQAGDESFNYQEPRYTWPAYKNTNVGGTTNLGNLSTPAVQQTWTTTPGPSTEDVTCSLSNNYNKPLNGMYLEFPMKMLTGGYYYQLSNGTWGETFDVSPSVRMNQVNTSLTAGQMNKAVRVQKSAAPDTTPPNGSVLINGGAASTSTTDVTLTLSASDSEAGVGEMMVSNDAGFAGAVWEPYKTTKSWALTAGESGTRTVYVKYRDRAMPGNEVVKNDAIYYNYAPPAGPRIISITPNSATRPNSNVSVTIVGENTHFVQGQTHLTVNKEGGTGLTINGPGGGTTNVVDPTHATASLNVTTSATYGYWDIGVTNGAESVTPLQNGFLVDGPRVTAVAPTSGRAGQTLNVAITGNAASNWVNGTSQAVFQRDGGAEPNVTVNSTTVTDPTHCTANITIGIWCDPGLLDVAVNTLGMSGALVDGFQIITHNPRITSVSPSAGVRNQTLWVHIYGADTSFVNGQSVASFGSGITVNSTSVSDPEEALANITISSGAGFGPRNVAVTTGSEVATLNSGFTVEQFDPVVQSVSPDHALNTGPVTIDVNGVNFSAGNAVVKLTKASQSDLVPTGYTTRIGTKITCTFNLTGQMAGPWNVVVTNPDGKSSELSNGFTVQWPAPTLSSVTPDTKNQGETFSTVLIGTNFKEGATVKMTKTGQTDLVPTGDPLVTSSSQIDCTFALAADVKQGRWNVVVTNLDGQSATLVNGFTIPFPNAPTVDSIDPTSGQAGDVVSVTITGTHFEDLAVPRLKSSAGYATITGSSVSINPAKTELTCNFDLSGARSGYRGVEVMNDDGQLDEITNAFRVTSAATPAITTLSPTSGNVGAVVNITGTDFGATRADSVVKFNGTAATVYTSWSDTSIQCKVPSGATTGEVKVTACGRTSNGVDFTVNGTQPPPPPEEEKDAWYLAEGTSDYGFGTYINIQNPNSTAVTAMVTYMTKAGPRTRAALTLPAMSQTVINPMEDIGATDFSTKVECKEGKTICVDRRMVWTGPGSPSSEGHSSVGVTSAAKKWYLAEGSSKWGFETWLLIQNPGNSDAKVTVTYMIEGQGPVPKVKTVKAGTRASFNMETDIGQADASIMIESDQPVIPERAMYRYNRREGHDSIGTTTPAKEFYLAEGTTDWGFTTYVLVQNPNSAAATINITYMTPTGAVAQPAFTMPANSRKTINVNDIVPKKDLSIKVTGSLPIIAERAMYWGAGTPLGEACHDSIGMASPHMTFFMPDGETYNGTETWTLVQNPNSVPVNIEVRYLGVNGQGNKTLADTIPANSRKSYNMADEMPSARAAVVVVSKTTGKPIMVERSMYWSSRGGGTDTIGGFSN